jgi:preprotein translocase subunit SecF
MSNTVNSKRGTVAMVFAIILGLGIGFLIKKVHIGLLIGLVIGLMSSVMIRKK